MVGVGDSRSGAPKSSSSSSSAPAAAPISSSGLAGSQSRRGLDTGQSSTTASSRVKSRFPESNRTGGQSSGSGGLAISSAKGSLPPQASLVQSGKSWGFHKTDKRPTRDSVIREKKSIGGSATPPEKVPASKPSMSGQTSAASVKKSQIGGDVKNLELSGGAETRFHRSEDSAVNEENGFIGGISTSGQKHQPKRNRTGGAGKVLSTAPATFSKDPHSGSINYKAMPDAHAKATLHDDNRGTVHSTSLSDKKGPTERNIKAGAVATGDTFRSASSKTKTAYGRVLSNDSGVDTAKGGARGVKEVTSERLPSAKGENRGSEKFKDTMRSANTAMKVDSSPNLGEGLDAALASANNLQADSSKQRKSHSEQALDPGIEDRTEGGVAERKKEKLKRGQGDASKKEDHGNTSTNKLRAVGRTRNSSFDAREGTEVSASIEVAASERGEYPNLAPVLNGRESIGGGGRGQRDGNATEVVPSTMLDNTSEVGAAVRSAGSGGMKESTGAMATTTSFLEALSEEERRTRTRHLPDVEGFRMLHKSEIKRDLALARSMSGGGGTSSSSAGKPGRGRRGGGTEAAIEKDIVVKKIDGEVEGDGVVIDEEVGTGASEDETTSDVSGGGGGRASSKPSRGDSVPSGPSGAFIPPQDDPMTSMTSGGMAASSDGGESGGATIQGARKTDDQNSSQQLSLRSPHVVESITTFNPPRPPESVGPKKKHRLLRWERNPQDVEVDLANYRKTVHRTREELHNAERERERIETVGSTLRTHFMHHLRAMREESLRLNKELCSSQVDCVKAADLLTSKTRSRGVGKGSYVMRDVLSVLRARGSKLNMEKKFESTLTAGKSSFDASGIGGVSAVSVSGNSLSNCRGVADGWLLPGDNVVTPYGKGVVLHVFGPSPLDVDVTPPGGVSIKPSPRPVSRSSIPPKARAPGAPNITRSLPSNSQGQFSGLVQRHGFGVAPVKQHPQQGRLHGVTPGIGPSSGGAVVMGRGVGLPGPSGGLLAPSTLHQQLLSNAKSAPQGDMAAAQGPQMPSQQRKKRKSPSSSTKIRWQPKAMNQKLNILSPRVCVRLQVGVGYFPPDSVKPLEDPSLFSDEKLMSRWKKMVETGKIMGCCLDVVGMDVVEDAATSSNDTPRGALSDVANNGYESSASSRKRMKGEEDSCVEMERMDTSNEERTVHQAIDKFSDGVQKVKELQLEGGDLGNKAEKHLSIERPDMSSEFGRNRVTSGENRTPDNKDLGLRNDSMADRLNHGPGRGSSNPRTPIDRDESPSKARSTIGKGIGEVDKSTEDFTSATGDANEDRAQITTQGSDAPKRQIEQISSSRRIVPFGASMLPTPGCRGGPLSKIPLQLLEANVQPMLFAGGGVDGKFGNPSVPTGMQQWEGKRYETFTLSGKVLQLRNELYRQRRIRILNERSAIAGRDRAHRVEGLLAEMKADLKSLKERLQDELIELGIDQEKAEDMLASHYKEQQDDDNLGVEEVLSPKKRQRVADDSNEMPISRRKNVDTTISSLGGEEVPSESAGSTDLNPPHADAEGSNNMGMGEVLTESACRVPKRARGDRPVL